MVDSRAMIEKAKVWIKRNWGYADIALALASGVVVSVLGFFNQLSGDQLTQATLAVLSVLAFSLLHDRIGRGRSSLALRRQIRGVRTRVDQLGATSNGLHDNLHEALANLRSDYPFHPIEVEACWDIQSRERAQVIKRKRIRFTSSNITSIADQAEASGSVNDYSLYAGRPGTALKPLERTESRDDIGRPLNIFTLDRPWKRGEVMEYEVRRVLGDCFTSPVEAIRSRNDHPPEVLTLTVIWPPNEVPSELWIQRSLRGGETDRSDVQTSQLAARPYSRVALENWKATNIQPGETIAVMWRW